MCLKHKRHDVNTCLCKRQLCLKNQYNNLQNQYMKEMHVISKTFNRKKSTKTILYERFKISQMIKK